MSEIVDAPRQRILKTMGEGACYLLSIIHLAEKRIGKYIDAFATFLVAQGRMVVVGHATVPMVGGDCFVNGPADLLSLLMGESWTWSKESAGYHCAPGELEILRFEWIEKTTGTTITHGHFVVGDGSGAVAWDPYGASATVANGVMVSKRIFRRPT